MREVAIIVVLLTIGIILLPIPLEMKILFIIAIVLLAIMFCMRIRKSTVPPESQDSTVETYTPEVEEPRAFLNELPIETIEGIGEVYGSKLRAEGVLTVQDLLESDPDRVAEICDVNTQQVEIWIDMARFAWLDGVTEEDAEAIVLGAGIRELIDLANANPNEILTKVQEAVKRGDVRVPAGYEFTLEKVKRWISSAKDVASK